MLKKLLILAVATLSCTAFAALPAAAAPLAETPSTSSLMLIPANSAGPNVNTVYYVCLNSNNRVCLISRGPNNQVIVLEGAATPWTVTRDGTVNGNKTYTLQYDGTCLKAYGSGEVTVGSAACNPSTANDRWEVTGSGPYSFENVGQGKFLGTVGNASGAKVWVENPHSGFYTGWTTEQF